jgi:glycosyltransferase involved in cell wall biosynthesis
MPKILLGISSSFCASFLKGQVRYLVSNGYEVVIISGRGDEISLLSKEENARLYFLDFTKKINPFSDLLCLFEIIQILYKEKPNIVNAGNPKPGLLIMIACFLLGIKNRIFTLHGLVSDSRYGFAGTIIKCSEKLTCLLARKIIVVSPTLLKHALELKLFPNSKGLIIEQGSCNGINLNTFSYNDETNKSKEALINKIQLPKDSFVIGFVGRLNKDKGMNLLFEAFNRLKLKYNNIYMLMVGPLEPEDAFNRNYIDQLFTDKHVFYLGKLNDVAPVYALMDVFVLPSFREGLPNVLMEAAAMEIPMIASNINGCIDVVQQDINGMLFKKGDVNELTAAIEKYILHPQLAKLHGSKGRDYVLSHYSQQKIWDGQLNVYKLLM